MPPAFRATLKRQLHPDASPYSLHPNGLVWRLVPLLLNGPGSQSAFVPLTNVEPGFLRGAVHSENECSSVAQARSSPTLPPNSHLAVSVASYPDEQSVDGIHAPRNA